MGKILSDFLYLLFPKHCIVCDRVIHPYDSLCDGCKGLLSPVKAKRCPRCGHTENDCCCGRYAYHFRGLVSPFKNEGFAQKAIYLYKFRRNTDAAEYFAEHMVRALRETFPDVDFDCITAVPMHKTVRRRRGFDHAEYLARAVSRELGVPFVRLLYKHRSNKTQHTLNAAERFENVKNAYKAYDNEYENVLLIDDIKTTGATLDECSRRLMLAGTENVYCATAVISA